MHSLTTAIIVSYTSAWVVKNCINSIEKKTSIIVVDNSNDYKLKSDLENSYKNLKVIINHQNKGFGNAANLAALQSDSKYLLFLGPDTKLEKKAISNLNQIAKNLNDDFGVLLPSENKLKKKRITLLKKPRGAALMFIMKKKFTELKGFDENFFLYYEDMDLISRFIKKKEKIYETPIQFNHSYGSHNKKHNIPIELNRNWHYLWSRFYFYRKNNNYLFAIIYMFPTLFRMFVRTSFHYFVNKKKFLFYKYRLLGLFNAYINKKSWYRPKI
jgi:GT2 family glycosyltransferase